MQNHRIISGDSHIREPFDLWWRTIGNLFGERTPRIVDEYKGIKGSFFFTGGHICKVITSDVDEEGSDQANLVRAAGHDPAKRIEFQDLAGVAGEVLFPSVFSPIMQAGVGDVVHAAAEVYNDWLAEFCSHAPDRLLGIAAIPMYDVELSIAELTRASKLGLRGAIINTIVPEGCLPYKHTHYDRFWALAQDLDIPIVLHIVTGRVLDPIVYAITKEEMDEAPQGIYDMFNEIHGALANEFVFGQILDRFPKLKVLDAEYEISWLPHFMFRLDQMQHAFTTLLSMPELKLPASEYVKTRVWHGVTDDPHALDAIKHVGADQVMWGSDFPHVRSIQFDTPDVLESMFGTLSAADQAQIVGGNVADVFGV